MKDNRLTRRSVLEMVKNRQISQEEAFRLLKNTSPHPLASLHSLSPAKGNESSPRGQWNDIAIIGMACRFPDAGNADEFWNNLARGKNSVREIPGTRWDINNTENYLEENPYKWGGFLSEIDGFDPLFFNISPREAERMDPQQRLFLQEAWRALADAGYADKDLNGKKCGVFVGCSASDYNSVAKNNIHSSIGYFFTGNASSILPARVSYFLNLKGPALALDTACSSSLTAIHLACESICSGTCHMAAAGGVSVFITPNFYLLAGGSGMLSPAGKCKTFDDSADGFVPGEGVGAVILKPLPGALQDGDHIYGVIKGSGMNQDGKTNGITAPSATSQTALECEVYDKFHIHPESINYIEAHGTGTKLGDPIEIHALTDAFGKYTKQKQFCAIGSVKTNIGHALSAAGIASVIKVLLALKHKQIPPSLHYKTPNQHIDFKNSPIYVNTRLNEWRSTNNNPRRAAVSSFGFSGTNVHLVLEEPPGNIDELYIFTAKQPDKVLPYYLINISAKTRSALEQKYKDLFNWLEARANEAIGNIAFTLNMGTSHFAIRSAMIVKDMADLKSRLSALIKNETIADFFSGDLEENFVKPDKTLKELGQQSINEIKSRGTLPENLYKSKLQVLADLFVRGYDLDWTGFYQGERYTRVSLPPYPFAREHHWITEPGNPGKKTGREINPTARQHPLIEQNTSDFEEQKFTTRMTGEEFYLQDHVVNKRKILPAVVYLEMARAAGEIAAKTRVKKIKDVILAKPIDVTTGACNVNICLYPDKDCTEAVYEISTGNGPEQHPVHARGRVVFETAPGDTHLPEYQPGYQYESIEDIKKRCPHLIDGAACYRLFQEAGLKYGPAFQAIQLLYYSDTEALSQIKLPAMPGQNIKDFQLHPSLMDAALQTISGIIGKWEKKSGTIYLPFSLGEVDILHPFPGQIWAYLTLTGNQQETADIIKFHVQLLDENGRILLKIKDYSLKAWKEDSQIQPLPVSTWAEDAGIPGPFYYDSVWEHEELSLPQSRRSSEIPEPVLVFDIEEKRRDTISQQWETGEKNPVPVILVKSGDSFRDHGNLVYEINPRHQTDYEKLIDTLRQNRMIPGKILHLWSLDDREPSTPPGISIKSRLQMSIYSLFYLTRALMAQKYENTIRMVYVYPGTGEGPHPIHAALGGFNRTIYRENPQFIYKNLEIPCNNQGLPIYPSPELIDLIFKEFNTGPGIDIRLKDGKRYLRKLHQLKPGKKKETGGEPGESVPLKDRGVYMLTGGLGSLGLIFARHLAGKVKARLVLTDISDLTPAKQSKIKELEGLGSEVLFVKANISGAKDVDNLVKKAKNQFKKIDGVLHTAGVICDAFILKKTRKEMEKVLAPKVYGTLYLDEALKDEKMDFFILFSSIAAEMGSIGQGDYAYANSFMNHFAQKREKQRENHERYGKTISYIWPFWQEGGMPVNEKILERMEKEVGIITLKTHRGLEAFELGLTLDTAQLLVLDGEIDKIEKIFYTASKNKEKESIRDITNNDPHSMELGENWLLERTTDYLKKLLSTAAKLPAEKIMPGTPLEKYGIDSLMILDLNRQLEADFGQLSKTLFYEYQRLNDLAGYFVKNHRKQLIRMLKNPVKTIPAQATLQHKARGKLRDLKSRQTLAGPFIKAKEPGPLQEDIAIIGLGGRYPMAKDLDEFWENLRQGRDCITEIPPGRWDHRLYYDPDKNNSSKTYGKWGSFLDDIDKFDPLFFSLSPKEAEIMDPQERIFLETVWHILEDAGYTRASLQDTIVGVFVGVMYGHYQLFGVEDMLQGTGVSGTSFYASIANRVSYFFDFHGPSIALDTMCSSSLTALHLACESIHSGQCEVAIAGGVNLSLHPVKYIQLGRGKFLSSDGHCRSFGNGGDGYVPGEGSGGVMLKSLSKAEADGDRIYALIKTSALNHGGKTNGYSVPNPVAQGRLIGNAIKKAGLEPRSISFIETHGTGTSLGDPIEITGLERAFAGCNLEKNSCPIGSIKSNLGHLESAAGIAALTKVLLQMKHKQLVPSLHSAQLNPNINFKDSSFYVQQELTQWKQPLIRENGKEKIFPLRAGISSFGAGGANAHVILEEYKKTKSLPPRHLQEGPYLIVLSARNQERLKEYTGKMKEFLEKVEPPSSQITKPSEHGKVRHDFKSILLNLVPVIIHVEPDNIDPREDLREYGFDAVKLAKLAALLNEMYNLDISIHSFSGVTPSSIEALAGYLHDNHPGSLNCNDDGYININTANTADHKLPQTIHLADIAYTLQIGREPMEERIALVAPEINACIEKLSRYNQGDPDIPGFYTGNARKDRKKMELLLVGKAGEEYLKIIMAEKKLDTLGLLWVSGADINWNLLYPAHTREFYHRISLPGYPFDRQRCWIPEPVYSKKKQDKNSTPLKIQPVKEQVATAEPLKGKTPDPGIATTIIRLIQKDLKEFIQTLLKVREKDITIDEVMFEYGFDSISFIEYINRIKNTYNIEFEIQAFFDLGEPTIIKLAQYLYKTFKDKLINHFQATVPMVFDTPGNRAEEAGQETVATAKTRETAVADTIEVPIKKSTMSLSPQIEEDILSISSTSLTTTKDGYDETSIQVFIREINNKFKIEVTPESFLERSSIGAFIKYLKRNFKSQFRSYYNQKK